jgi:hypothetical protein
MVIFLIQLHHFRFSHKGSTHKLFLHVLSNVTCGFVLFLQLEFYATFKLQHPEMPIGLSSFQALKPFLYEGLLNGTFVDVDTMKNYNTCFKDLTT